MAIEGMLSQESSGNYYGDRGRKESYGVEPCIADLKYVFTEKVHLEPSTRRILTLSQGWH